MKPPQTPTNLQLIASVELTARGVAPSQDGVAGSVHSALPKFRILANTGSPMRVPGFAEPVILDFRGVKFARDVTPIIANHDPALRIGHTTTRSVATNPPAIVIEGVVSSGSDVARGVVDDCRNGFPFQASVGATILKAKFLREGQTAEVNGQSVKGPLVIAVESSIREISVLPLGADSATQFALVAAHANKNRSSGTQNNSLLPSQSTIMEPFVNDNDQTPVTDPHSLQAAAEARRVGDIQAYAAEFSNVRTVAHEGKPVTLADLTATAIENGWEPRRFENALLRGRIEAANTAPAVHVVDRRVQSQVIEAAFSRCANLPNIEAHYDERVLEQSHAPQLRNIGLQQLLLMGAAANGYRCVPGERLNKANLRQVLAHAFPDIRASHTSTISVPNLLSNVANKFLLTGWQEGDAAWREIADIKPVSDFKEARSNRLLDDLEYEELKPNGKIAHGTVAEEYYTRQAHTYAKMFALTRVDMINDDLGAFSDLKKRVGLGASRKFNRVFWTTFLANSAFFTSARGNYIDGATTNLGTDGVGLELGVLAFRALRSADGKRVGGKPEILLVPPELEFKARRLFASTNVSAGGGSSDSFVPSDNPFAGLYRPVVADQLSDEDYPGSSATAWYLLRNPGLAPAIVASFLDGIENPTVQQADADFDMLGIQLRGYHDFGVDLAEWLAGIKSKGAAA